MGFSLTGSCNRFFRARRAGVASVSGPARPWRGHVRDGPAAVVGDGRIAEGALSVVAVTLAAGDSSGLIPKG
jgi:hypothetical protein